MLAITYKKLIWIQLRLTHAIRSRICIYRLLLLSQPDLPLSTFVAFHNCSLELWPLHAFIQKELAQQCHVWSYYLHVQVSSMSHLIDTSKISFARDFDIYGYDNYYTTIEIFLVIAYHIDHYFISYTLACCHALAIKCRPLFQRALPWKGSLTYKNKKENRSLTQPSGLASTYYWSNQRVRNRWFWTIWLY